MLWCLLRAANLFGLCVNLGLAAHAQYTWETEREKEHGILRVSISNTSDPLLYFVGQYPDGSHTDTLRNTEAHLDLGSTDPRYGYQIAHLLKAMPPELYGRKGQHIYDNWEFVSFPIFGLASVKVWVNDRTTNERMELHFTLQPNDTVDFVFDIGFSPGCFLIDAPTLKRTGSADYQVSRRRLPNDELLRTLTRYDRSISFVTRSMTDNRKLDIVGIEDPTPLRCVRFDDRLRYVGDGPEAVVVREHPWYSKMKFTQPVEQMAVPDYMQADPEDERQHVHCVERVYVKPVHLRSAQTKFDLSRMTVNNGMSVVKGDTTFLALEGLLESWLFTQSMPCNWPEYSASTFDFTYNADSVLSVQMTVQTRPLPAADAEQLRSYSGALERARQRYERQQKRSGRFRFGRLFKATVKAGPPMPSAGPTALPLPELDVEVPVACDSVLPVVQPNFLNNGYYSWQPVLPCYPMDALNVLSTHYRAFVVNPYTLYPYDPEQLFGERFRAVVYAEMQAVYAERQAWGVSHPFNLNHYLPSAKRYFMWGLDTDSVIVYFGNEGEFNAWFMHRIPFSRFADE